MAASEPASPAVLSPSATASRVPASARPAPKVGAASAPLLDPDFLHKLEQLELVSRKIIVGRMKGERKSRRKGSSVEFAEHRNYTVGDDLRHIDGTFTAGSTSSS